MFFQTQCFRLCKNTPEMEVIFISSSRPILGNIYLRVALLKALQECVKQLTATFIKSTRGKLQ